MFGVNLNEVLVDITKLDFSQADKALAFGGSMLLIGMLTVFSVLVCLLVCLLVFKVVFHDLPAKKKAKPAVAAAEATPIAETKSNAEDEIVAVIAAAIAMAESESSGLKFKVVSFRRK